MNYCKCSMRIAEGETMCQFCKDDPTRCLPSDQYESWLRKQNRISGLTAESERQRRKQYRDRLADKRRRNSFDRKEYMKAYRETHRPEAAKYARDYRARMR